MEDIKVEEVVDIKKNNGDMEDKENIEDEELMKAKYTRERKRHGIHENKKRSRLGWQRRQER